MFGLKFGKIVPFIMLLIIITVILVGIYQLNSDGNPWYFGREPEYQWDFLR